MLVHRLMFSASFSYIFDCSKPFCIYRPGSKSNSFSTIPFLKCCSTVLRMLFLVFLSAHTVLRVNLCSVSLGWLFTCNSDSSFLCCNSLLDQGMKIGPLPVYSERVVAARCIVSVAWRLAICDIYIYCHKLPSTVSLHNLQRTLHSYMVQVILH